MIATSAAGLPSVAGAGEKMGDGFDRVLRGREADALQAVAAQSREPLQRQSEMGAALVRRDGVDLVHDHRAGARQHRAPGLRAEQHVKRFRRRHQNVRRAAAHPLALGDGRVSRSDPGADLDIGKPAPAELLPDAGQRRLEILMDVVRQRLERRHVDDLRRIARAAPRDPVARDRRSPPERPRASCPIPWARR